MPEPTNEGLGTLELERGMRPSPASSFRTIALIAVLLLLLFNSGGLVRWAQQLPSNPVNAWLAERAADWDRLMHVPPADVLENVKKLLRVEGP
jgi:hypothetical protein